MIFLPTLEEAHAIVHPLLQRGTPRWYTPMQETNNKFSAQTADEASKAQPVSMLYGMLKLGVCRQELLLSKV